MRRKNSRKTSPLTEGSITAGFNLYGPSARNSRLQQGNDGNAEYPFWRGGCLEEEVLIDGRRQGRNEVDGEAEVTVVAQKKS